jgi:hypothetical protein
MMRRFFTGALVGGVLGVLAGFAIGIFAYPYIFLADIVADERLDAADMDTVVASGEFIHANPADPIHYGSGGLTVYRGVVQLHQDFEVGPGPAYHVYLVPDASVTPDTDVARTMFVDLGRLRAFRGSQIYRIPEGVDLAEFGSVVIWCEHFGVLISPASLRFE